MELLININKLAVLNIPAYFFHKAGIDVSTHLMYSLKAKLLTSVQKFKYVSY